MVPGPAWAATGDRLKRSRLVQTFADDFSPLDIYDPVTNPKGRWKTNYDFGWQLGASSRTLNGEQEVYVSSQYDGVNPFGYGERALIIKAARNKDLNDPKTAGKPYTSGILTTSTSFSQLYGYFEMRAQLPVVPGAWPAFWLVTPLNPAITAPQYGDEIDVMEFLGQDSHTIYCSLHWPLATGGVHSKTFPVPISRPDEMHSYGVLWTPDSIVWYVDDIEVSRHPNPKMNQPMYMILNLAVGGWNNNLPPESLPAMAERVSHVRAYKLQ